MTHAPLIDDEAIISMRFVNVGPADEPPATRMLFLAAALAIAAAYFYFLLCFWAPASGGIDQNGYLVGGKMIADHFSGGFKPTEPYEYVGWMWVLTGDSVYHPKYPIGLPLLHAIPMWIDWSGGKSWAFYIAPICTTFSLLAMFLMSRLITRSSFLGVLAMLLLGCAQTTLAIANSPWSHAAALCFVTWGMYLLLRWWQTGTLWRGVVAGFLLGYAVTIRYTEGLLALPIALVFASMVRWRHPRTIFRAAVPIFAWLVPVIALVTYNKLTMGTWTGYDTTNESTGFTWREFQNKWEFMVQQLYDYGLFFIVPLAIVGFIAMYRASWSVALYFTLWFVPGVLTYTAYYWGLQRAGVGYLRFFLTLFPPMIVASCWMMQRAFGHDQRRAIAMPLACGILVAISSAIGLRNMIPNMEREHAANLNLAWTCDQILLRAPTASVVFADQGGAGPMQSLLNFLQFKGDYELYPTQAFNPNGMIRRGNADRDPDQPHPMQPARQRYLRDVVYKDKSADDLVREQHRIVDQAVEQNRRAFVVVPANLVSRIRGKFTTGGRFELVPVMKWKEPAAVAGERHLTPLMPQQRPFDARRAPQIWQMFEIKRTTRSTTQPLEPII